MPLFFVFTTKCCRRSYFAMLFVEKRAASCESHEETTKFGELVSGPV